VNFSSTGLIDGHRPIRRHQHLRRLRRWYMAKLDAEIAALEARCSHGDYPTTERVPILNIILMDEDQAHRRWAYAIALRDQARAGRFLDPFSPTPRIDPPGAARGDHASATTRPPVTGLPATLSLAGLDAAMRREFLRIVTRALRHDRYPETDGFERAHLALALEPEAPPL
jgi:hypothetical protein